MNQRVELLDWFHLENRFENETGTDMIDVL